MNLTWFYGTNYSNYFTIDYTTRHIFDVNKNTAIVDGITKSYASQSFQMSLPLYLLLVVLNIYLTEHSTPRVLTYFSR